MLCNAINKLTFLQKLKLRIPKLTRKQLYTIAVCSILTLVMTITAQHYTLNAIRHRYDVSVVQGNVQRMLEEHREELREQQEAEERTQQERQEHAEMLSQVFSVRNENQNNAEIIDANYTRAPPQEEMSDEEAFLYSIIFLDLLSFGYDVFPAIATLANGQTVRGFGFTDYSELFAQDGNDDTIFIGAGFIALLNEYRITENHVSKGIIITPAINEEESNIIDNQGLEEIDYEFLLSFELEWGPFHYVAHGQYVRYGVVGYNIWKTSILDNPELYDLSLGFLYSFDLGRAIYDPALGQEFNPDGFNITQGIDYDLAIRAYRDIIFNQDQAKVILDQVSFTTIDIAALNAFLISNQREEFIGVPASQIHFIEMNLHESVFYYICGVTGEIGFIQIPPDLQMGWKEWLSVSLAAVGVVVGVIMVATGVLAWKGAGLTALSIKMATSILMGAAMTINSINQIGATVTGQPIFNSQFLAGSMQTTAGGFMISRGLSLAKSATTGPFGMFLAVLQVTIGILQIYIGTAEMMDAVFDFNWLTDGLGLSEEFYRNFVMIVNFAATAVVISAGIYKWHQSKAHLRIERSENQGVDSRTPAEVTKKIPNPYGKKGGPAHQAKVQSKVTQLETAGFEVTEEVRFTVQNGVKKSRWADIVAVKTDADGNKSVEIWQIGRHNAGGFPVTRESFALADIRLAIGQAQGSSFLSSLGDALREALVDFINYN